MKTNWRHWTLALITVSALALLGDTTLSYLIQPLTSASTNTVPVVTSANTITYEAVPNAALANASTAVNGHACALGSTCSTGISLMGISTQIGTGLNQTVYCPYFGALDCSTSESGIASPTPVAGTVSNLYVTSQSGPGNGVTLTVTWRKAGSGTTLTCSMTGVAQSTCSDTSHSFTVSAGDLIDIQYVVSGAIETEPIVTIASMITI